MDKTKRDKTELPNSPSSTSESPASTRTPQLTDPFQPVKGRVPFVRIAKRHVSLSPVEPQMSFRVRAAPQLPTRVEDTHVRWKINPDGISVPFVDRLFAFVADQGSGERVKDSEPIIEFSNGRSHTIKLSLPDLCQRFRRDEETSFLVRGHGRFKITFTLSKGNAMFKHLLQMREGALEEMQHQKFNPPSNDSDRLAFRLLIAGLIFANVLLARLGRHLDISLTAEPGYLRGLAKEIKVVASEINPSIRWPNWLLKLYRVAFRNLPIEDFWIVGGDATKDDDDGNPESENERRDERGETASASQPRRDRTRLPFCMRMRGYKGFRESQNRNALRYSAAVFDMEHTLGENQILLLESEMVGNAAYILRGPLSELLAVASRKRVEIRSSSPYYLGRVRHDHERFWRDELPAAMMIARTEPRVDLAVRAIREATRRSANFKGEK